ncbi:MAG: hypothetical protein ACOX85_11320 [Candidatus Pararuminococcus gallinarum]|jgi:hypothetical protein
MNYCVLTSKNIIENIIVCNSDKTATEFGAVPSYIGARIGELYNPPPPPEPEPTVEDITLDLMAEHEERLCMLEITTGI